MASKWKEVRCTLSPEREARIKSKIEKEIEKQRAAASGVRG
jgi:hypothetical protein